MEVQPQRSAIVGSMAHGKGLNVPTEIWAQIFEEIIQSFFDEDSDNKFINTGDYWLFHTKKGKGVSALRGLLAFEHVISRDRKLYRHFFSLRIQMSRVVISSDDVENNMFDNPKGMHNLSRLFRNSMREVTIAFRSTTHERRYFNNIIDHMRDIVELLTRGLFSVTNINHLAISLDDNLSILYFDKDLSHFAAALLFGGIARFMGRSPLRSLTLTSFVRRNEEDYFTGLGSRLTIQGASPQSYEVGITSALPRAELDEFFGVKGEKIYIRRPSREDYSVFEVFWVGQGGKRLPCGEK